LKSSEKEKLKEIENSIADAYSKGKINEMHYDLLKNKITNLLNSKE
jgi:hypothetical protein